MSDDNIKFHQEAIATNWNKIRVTVIATAHALLTAKKDLSKEAYRLLVDEGLPFKDATARKLIKIATSKHINEGSHIDRLPNSWGTLYEIAMLSDEQLQDGLKRGLIRPDVMRSEIEEFRKPARENELDKFMLTIALDSSTTNEQVGSIKQAIREAISRFEFATLKDAKVIVA